MKTSGRFPSTIGIKYLPFSFLSGTVAETGRRELRLGERRHGARYRPGDANDHLVLSRVHSHGHPILRQILARMNQQNSTRTEAQNLHELSEFFAYPLKKESRYSPTQKCMGPKRDDSSFKPVRDAIIAVMTDDYVGKIWIYEFKARYYGLEEKKQGRGAYVAGMFSGRCILISRKFWEYSLQPLRNMPSYLRLVEGKTLKIVDDRTQEEQRDGLDLRLLTRLHVDREDLLVHPFPKIVLGKLTESLRVSNPDHDEVWLKGLGFDLLNNMFGFNLCGNYNHTMERTNRQGEGTFGWSIEVAEAFKEAYEEYFEDEVDDAAWKIHIQHSINHAGGTTERKRNRVQYLATAAQYRSRLRSSEVKNSRRWYTNQLQRNNTNHLNLSTVPRDPFCENVLRNNRGLYSNVRVYTEPWVVLRGIDRRLSPWEAIELFDGQFIEVYVGITAYADRNERPLKHVALDYYSGVKGDAIADNWQSSFLFDVVDPIFNDRRFNMGHGEHKMQEFFEDHSNSKIKKTWHVLEPEPIYGENQGNLPATTGYIGLYLNIRFVYPGMEPCEPWV